MMILYYVEDELLWLDEDDDRREELDESVDNCAICGRSLDDWSDELERFHDYANKKLGRYPTTMPVNLCAKCSLTMVDELD